MTSEVTMEQLYEMQKQLDARIIKEKGLEGQDLLPNTVLALQVEIAELANEWRGFKHWSNDREPRVKVDDGICFECGGTGRVEYPQIDKIIDCPKCEDGRVYKNKLLEEYVDCLHFFPSIARQLELKAEDLYVTDDLLESSTTIVFSELLHNVGLIHADLMLEREFKDVHAFKKDCFRGALFIFHTLGEQRLGFTFEQITEAYMEKNRVNHQRQSNGY